MAHAAADTVTQIGARVWHNYVNSLDVSGAGGQPDGLVVAGDALAIINYINAFGAGHIPLTAASGPPYLDTTGPGDTGDDFVVPADALAVINFINAFGAGSPGPAGEGENAAPDPAFATLDSGNRGHGASQIHDAITITSIPAALLVAPERSNVDSADTATGAPPGNGRNWRDNPLLWRL